VIFGVTTRKKQTDTRQKNVGGNAMRVPRRQFLRWATSAAALSALPRRASALDYPTRPVRVIVGYSAGSAPDIGARLIGQWLSERLGQQFVVENRPGAGTNLSTETVVRAAPDGYTLLLIATPTLADGPIAVTLQNHKFTPAEIHVKANTPAVIALTNKAVAENEMTKPSAIIAGRSLPL